MDCKTLEIKAGTLKGKEGWFFAYRLDKVKSLLIDGVKSIEFKVKRESRKTIEASRRRLFKREIGMKSEIP